MTIIATIAIIAVAIIAFVVGFVSGVHYTSKIIVEGKLENVKYTG